MISEFLSPKGSTWQNCFEQRPEPRAMIMLTKMTELVSDDIFRQTWRQEDQTIIEGQGTLGRTAPPARPLIPDGERRVGPRTLRIQDGKVSVHECQGRLTMHEKPLTCFRRRKPRHMSGISKTGLSLRYPSLLIRQETTDQEKRCQTRSGDRHLPVMRHHQAKTPRPATATDPDRSTPTVLYFTHLFSAFLRYCPVCVPVFNATSSGVPVATTFPPPEPPSGPISMT